MESYLLIPFIGHVVGVNFYNSLKCVPQDLFKKGR